jgi:adenylate cyclase
VTGPVAHRHLCALGELGARISAATSFEEVVDATLLGLDELFGYRHSMLLVHQLESDRLVTLAARGYAGGGVGSEVALGTGVIGMAAVNRRPMRIGNLQRMLLYARTVQRSVDDGGPTSPEIRLPGLPQARSQLAAPMMARSALIGVVVVESETALAFEDSDEQALAVVAHLAGGALDREQVVATSEPDTGPAAVAEPAAAAAPNDPTSRPTARLRHYVVDGSTFIDDDYLIKGVAGRLLWKVVAEHIATGRTAFTNREARLDPALELPPFRDNFESRLILLKRRLDERQAPVRIVSAGRGRFELRVDADIVLERVAG